MNTITFLSNVGIEPNFIFRFFIPIYGVGEVGFLKFCTKTAFSIQGYFRHFSHFWGVFANRSPLPNFRILKAAAPSKCRNEVMFSQKSYFILKNVNNLS